MKKIKITIAMAAFAAGIFGAFAFKPAKVTQSSGEFYVNSEGQPTGEMVDQSHPCLNASSPLCSGTFDIIEGEPDPDTGRDYKNGPRQ